MKMQIWDTAGQERFRAMTPMFYRGANAALLVFDLTDYASFDDIMGWVTELQRKVQDSMVLILVGNKCDLSERREVNKDEAIQYAKSIGGNLIDVKLLSPLKFIRHYFIAGYYFETSSVSNHDHYQSIEKVFTQTALGLIRLSESSNTVLRRYDSIDSLPHISLSNNSILLDSAMATSAITLGGDLLNDDNGLPMETGRVENVAFSHDHIALGNEHRGGCCW